MKKIFNSRFFTIVILAMVLCTLFTSCTSQQQTTVSITDVSVIRESELTPYQLSAAQLILNSDDAAWIEFVYAYKGYDILGADANLSEYPDILDENGDYVVNLEAAKKVITKYDTASAFNLELLTADDVKAIVLAKSNLTKDDLNAIATLVRNNSAAWSDFVAAYRGYDVLGADADLGDYSQTKDVNLEAAKAVLAKYDSKGTLNYSALSENDVKSIVDAMKMDVSFEEQRDIFETLRFWIGSFLGWLTNTIGFGNYLVGICIFAIIVEICMLPLTIKQQKNSIKQAKLRPKEMAIRNRYKGRNDQATQQKAAQEIQDLYQRENFNPMGGCLPMLIQLPIIMLLYNIVIDPIQYVVGGTASFSSALKVFFTASKAAGGLGMTLTSTNGTIEMLSQLKDADISALADFSLFNDAGAVYTALDSMLDKIPSFNIGPVNFGFTPSLQGNYWLLIVPVLTFVVYFFTMKISKKFTYQATQNEQAPGQGCSNKMMEFYMPVMSTFFSFMVPGAIGIYWVFRSVISTLKQFIMSKVMPLPVFTEEDYKAAERELNSSRPQRRRKKEGAELDPNRERPRSLHHIDDDDEEYPTFVK